MADRVGEQLGNYRLLQLIGRGGFADVYLGEHVRLGNQYAIKVLQTRLETEDIEAFQREARTIGRLAHPNIVRVYDFAVQDGTPFLAMDYAPNGTLRQRYPKNARVPLEAVRVYVRQVADALNYAHEQRVIHRDVKPENMLIGPLDDILLSDFGIAVVSQSSRYQTSNEMVGTVGYMAPEQIQGHPRPASDQYALGVVVYEWLCGERPFRGSVTEVATQHLAVAPPPLRAKVPDLSPALEDVVLTALAKDPDQRFANVRAFAAALENAASAEPSIYSLSTQLSAPVIPPPPQPGAPSGPNVPLQPSGPSVGAGSEMFPPPPSTPFASTIAGSLPFPGDTLGNAETILSSQPLGSQPPGFASQGYGSAPVAPSGWVVNPSQPWGYGAPAGPQIAPLPPPPPMPPPGSYPPSAAPGATQPPRTRRGPLLWVIIALIVLLVGGSSATALIVLNAPHPKITVSSSYSGAALGGPPDTVLHVNGQQFSGNSTITFLLDGLPAPGAQLAQSDSNGAFSVNLTITDDWTFSKHTLTARDASGHVTQQGVSITVVPQPVLEVKSDYQDGSTPAGSASTSFDVSGKRFAPNALVTFLLDGQPVPGSQPTSADARGRVQVTLVVTNDWSIGNHTLTAQDNQGDSTQTQTPLEIVHQGEAGTPGPNGAPADNASFTIFITIQAKDVGTGAKNTFKITLNVSQGKVCNNGVDTGQPQTTTHNFSNGTSYKETITLTCSGTYKAGHLSYTETDTQDTFQLSDGGYCIAQTPRIEELLKGTFSSGSAISGSFKSDGYQITCPTVNTFYLVGANAQTGSWSGTVG
ncbi:MAG TPA: protein kinase [Ktedonobacterales bacterium]|nr:protein kinase [Ktedonobacterales bacterium]